MLDTTEVIVQDQLIPSSALGKVRVVYPRGAQSLLSFNNAGDRVINHDMNADGAWEQAVVTKNGHLLFIGDQSYSVPTFVLGADLK